VRRLRPGADPAATAPRTGRRDRRVEVARNAVTVGVSDIKSPQATALRARFGDAVEVFEDEPIELLRFKDQR